MAGNHKEVARMDALPRDVLVSILSSLPIDDVISVSQVSRWMLEASQDDRVWARREQWRSLPNLVAERAVGKWLGTVLGLPWQVIALNIKFDPRNDRKSETGSPTSALRHLVPCRAELYLCLLYTSPSPRDKRQSRMPSSA